MYRDLGFLRVVGAQRPGASGSEEGCAYLLYPHRPIVAYAPESRRLVGEYCVTFEDQEKPYGSGRLPDSDDVLAKWMALTADEGRVISVANMHLPGRQVDYEEVERDLQRLAQWERARIRQLAVRDNRTPPSRDTATVSPAQKAPPAQNASPAQTTAPSTR